MFKQSPKKKVFIGIILISIFMILTITKNTRQNFIEKEPKPESLFAIYINDEKTTHFPSKEEGYSFDEEKSFCNNGVNIDWSYLLWTANINFTDYELQNKERTYCNLYFKTREEYLFDYTGDSQEFVVPMSGYYQVELWGASAFHRGAYTFGNIKLDKDKKVYIFVGETTYLIDESASVECNIQPIFNNGTRFMVVNGYYRSRAGFGATDIRLENGVWNNFESLKSRIMVASGSGGYYSGGAGGGLVGYTGTSNTTGATLGGGGTQTRGGDSNAGFCYASQIIAGAGTDEAGGGGGGYYGGGGGYHYEFSAGGGGGSSFISGHNGCDAIKEDSTSDNIIHTGQSNHYSGYIFTDTKMIDGMGYAWTDTKQKLEAMPNPKGGYYDLGVGHTGNGYARITYLGK